MELHKIRNEQTLTYVYGQGSKSSWRCRVVQKNPPGFYGMVEIEVLQGAGKGERTIVTPEQLRPLLFGIF